MRHLHKIEKFDLRSRAEGGTDFGLELLKQRKTAKYSLFHTPHNSNRIVSFSFQLHGMVHLFHQGIAQNDLLRHVDLAKP